MRPVGRQNPARFGMVPGIAKSVGKHGQEAPLVLLEARATVAAYKLFFDEYMDGFRKPPWRHRS